MTTPHWRLILNGKSAGDDDLRSAVGRLREQGLALDVRVTWEGGDSERYVAEAIADAVDVIVAAGGDGTLSEVASALAHRDQPAESLPALGLVPLGTANDFAAAAGIPEEPLPALQLINATPALPVDLLRVDADDSSYWCVNLASGGFGTEVTVETDAGLKKMLGGLAYLITGIAKLGKIEPTRARLQGPDFAWEGDFIALGIGNGRQAGGGQALCPDARIDDGLLDLTVVPELSGEVAAILGTLAAAEGRDAALDRVAVRAQLPWVELAAEAPLVLNLDGEPVEARRFRIACVPARLRMHLPVDCPLLSAGRSPPV
ncbi:lipid kinase YegS [Pseudoxanthomonas sp. UTMC 1351]|uniref:lipid kinase YegS n=1 Tax=Pseudoxanthomonas sp. UTMC 1351 TaxID=2695853 RepID=UPI0034CD9891